MRPSLALACACVLLASSCAAAATQKGHNAAATSSSLRIRRALLQQAATVGSRTPLAEASIGAPAASEGPALPQTAMLLDDLTYGDEYASCSSYDPQTERWKRDRTRYDATGTDIPPVPPVVSFIQLICADPQAASLQAVQAVQAGGEEALVAVYALFNAYEVCARPTIVDDAFEAIDELVSSSGSAANFSAAQQWYSKFVEAADAVGVPVCLSLAVVDPEAGAVLFEQQLHTGQEL